MFPLCFRWAFGAALHAARADLLRFGHLTHSLRRADTRTGLTPQRDGLGRGTRGRTWTRLAPPTRVRGRSEGRGLIIRDEAGLEGGRAVDSWNPHPFRPSLPRRPGLDQPRLPPTTLEDCPTSPRKTRTTCGNTRELMNKHPALVLRSIRFRPTLSISTGRCARCPSVLCAADACGGGAAVVPAIGDRLYRRALRQQGCEWLGHPLERRPGIFDAARSIARRGGPSRRRRTLLHGVSDGPDGSAAAPRITIE